MIKGYTLIQICTIRLIFTLKNSKFESLMKRDLRYNNKSETEKQRRINFTIRHKTK